MRLRPYRDPLLKYWAVLPDDLLQRVLLYYQLSRSCRRCSARIAARCRAYSLGPEQDPSLPIAQSGLSRFDS